VIQLMTTTNKQEPVIDTAAWHGPAISTAEHWRYSLNAHDIDDLKKMASCIRPLLDNDPNKLLSLSKNQFSLGAFTPSLKQLHTELKQGLGIVLIKGLPISEIAPIDVATIYWGIGLHLGQATPNNPDGDMFGHITDLGKSQKDANSRGYQTREAMDYHCDQSDIVGLICIRAAKSGGVSKIASSIAMFNELLRTHPEHAAALTKPLYWSKMGEHADGELPYYQSPVFNFLDDKLCVSFGPKHIEKGHALPGTPPLSELQCEAIRLAEEIADRQRIEMELDPGDMQFLNNYVTVHTRTAYIDHDDPMNKRLLWRLWLMDPHLRPRTGYTKQFQNGLQLATQRNKIRL